MKMHPEHYAIMAAALDHIRPMIDAALPDYQSRGFSHKRYRWDAFRAAQIAGNSTRWQCDTLYPYLDDEHCDTALRHYFGVKS